MVQSTRAYLMLFILSCASVSAHAEQTNTTNTSKNNASTNVLFIGAAHSNKTKANLLIDVAKSNKASHWNITHKTARSLKNPADIEALFNTHDLIFLDAVSIREASKTFEAYLPLITQSNKKVVSFKWLENANAQKGVSKQQHLTLAAYWENAGRVNLDNMLNYIASDIFQKKHDDLTVVRDPIIFPHQGIYHPKNPDLMTKSLKVYHHWSAPKNNQPRIGILMQRALIETEQTQLIDETIKKLEAKGAYVVPFFFKLSPVSGDYSHLLQSDVVENGKVVAKKTEVDVIINFRNIHWANKRKVEFEKFGVPVVQALTHYSGGKKSWEDSKDGISSGMMSFTLVLPESAGIIDPIVVSAMNRRDNTVEIIDYQLDFLIERSVNYAKLAINKNANKKLTTMFWGDRDMGASFLNVPESLKAISHRLHHEGYNIEKVDAQYFIDRVDRILNPFYRDFELDALLKDDLAELLPLSEYEAWLATVPQETVSSINKKWGQPADNFMITEREGKKYFVIPRIRNGNMLILRQPPRGDSKDKEQALYHDTKVPMNHYYLAAYFYAREYWNSDAFIHLGTHGTHEYLPGKDRGLSRYDGANLSTGTIPVLYPYIVDDVGEAMQAKRRGNAITIGHMTPPFAAAGLQGVTADMHMLVDQYRHIDTGGVKEKTKKQIIDFCIKENLCKDLHYDMEKINKDFDLFLQELHTYLEELASANQPLGLHSFGELAEQLLIISTLGQMLGNEFLSVASEFEKSYYEQEDDHHHHHESKHKKDHDKSSHDKDNESKHAEISDGLMHFINEDLSTTAGFKTLHDFVVNAGDLSELNDEVKPYVELAKTYYKDMLGIKELDNLVAGLNGQFIAPKNGGDPVRNPSSLPSGFNLIGFDPSRLPTKAAYEQGSELVEEIITNYRKKHGQYPDKLAFSLWSVEAMRHYGVLESQALYAMGLRPKWSPDGRVVGTEIIPYSELKRPRVDVVLSATGLYRDAFPNVMELLAKAIQELSSLKEESNSIWKNSERVKQQLQAEGVEEAEAEYLSSVRIFSNTFGDYGSGVDEPIMNSDTWESDKKISDNYLANMGHYFGADKSRWGQKVDNLYAKQLSGTDVAVFARSSNLYGMITSDDPFEYFGSLALAVRNIDGKSPEMMISNLRNVKKAKMEMADAMLAKELRTRNFHKRWITEMQKEGYSGAVTMSGNLANFWGWQVVAPDVVRNDQWDEFVDIYVNDELELGLNEWFEKVNPGALAQMIERMLEAERKDYWEADPQRLKQLVERYIELVNKYDLIMLNDSLRENVNELAQGFGLSPLTNAVTMQDMAKKSKQTLQQQKSNQSEQALEQVEGQKLEKQQKSKEAESDYFLIKALIAMGLIILIGAMSQLRRKR